MIYDELTEAGIIPILQYLDNETSKELIASIKKRNLKFQLAAPHDHQLNPANRAVSTFKNHFIVILAGCDERFPKYLWCQLIPQAVITLNMLLQSRINPKLSAHDQVFGTFNYQRTPLVPLGTKVIIHKRPDQRKTLDKHGLSGFLVNRAKDHFQSYQVSVTRTGATRVSDAIELLPSKYTMPKTSSNDRISIAFE